jgi:hypothetical protein
LVGKCIHALQKIGIGKAHIFALRSNGLANDYWTNRGWQLREDLNLYSFNSSSNKNA